MKTFDRALGFSLALHVAVVALWQWRDAHPTAPKPQQASLPIVVSLSQPRPQPVAEPAPPRPAAPLAAPAMAALPAQAAATVLSTPVTTTSMLPAAAVVSIETPAATMPQVGGAGDKGGANASAAALELPSTEADYWHNPKPAYPSLSRRLGEQGKVLVRVFIDASGQPQQAEVKQSSGFERLDQTALNTVLKWRYLPGKRNGTPEAMWLQVPLEFRLE